MLTCVTGRGRLGWHWLSLRAQLIMIERMTESPVTSNSRPSNVILFEQLWYLSLGIGVIQSILQWHREVALAHAAGRGIHFILFIQGFVLAVTVLFIWLIARRRKNWARWVLLTVTIVGIPFALPGLSLLLRSGLVTATLVCAQNLAQVAALYLVFTGDAREWFRSSSILLNSTRSGFQPN